MEAELRTVITPAVRRMAPPEWPGVGAIACRQALDELLRLAIEEVRHTIGRTGTGAYVLAPPGRAHIGHFMNARMGGTAARERFAELRLLGWPLQTELYMWPRGNGERPGRTYMHVLMLDCLPGTFVRSLRAGAVA